MTVKSVVRKAVSASVGVIAVVGAMQAQAQAPICIQDQYGNQYNIVLDNATLSISGSATMAQCNNDVWPVVGGYNLAEVPGPGIMLHLSAANSVQSPACVDTFMLRGIFPEFEWYYQFGYGAQPAVWVGCGSPVTSTESSGGAAK